MFKVSTLAAAAAVLALGTLLACNNAQPGVATLVITVSLRQIDNVQQQSQITVQAIDENGKAGTGQVNLTATAGCFDSTCLTSTTVLTLSNGTANANYQCPVAHDSRCNGTEQLTATWPSKNNASQTTTLTVGNGTTTNDGGPDGGTGFDGGSNGALSVTASKNPIFFNVGDFSDITALIDGGSAGQSIAFTTNLGGFVFPGPDGGTPAPTITGTTDSSGKTVVRFRETGAPGAANVLATQTSTGTSAGITINITTVQQIVWVSTSCGGAICTIMGLRGSGFNEQAQVTFKVVDSSNHPVPGVNVTFALTSPPAGTTVLPNAITDANGVVTANVSAGASIGAFTVKATVVPGQIETQSPNIGLRGAKPTNNGFTLNCQPVNVSAYAAVNPPLELSVNCDVTLVDRFHNPVGTGTTVNFKSEAGSVPASVSTIAYPNPGEGTATIVFSTRGVFPPLDVPPLTAAPSQWPLPRFAEPSIAVGPVIHNPRDGLVTVIAYLRGEEFYDDTNANGQWDPGERFFDQGEAFVDANDNGVWDLGEFYVDDAPPNGMYDGPNGRYDSNTTVWTETRILYTGRPLPDVRYSYIIPDPFSSFCPGGGVPNEVIVGLAPHLGDLNLNRPPAGTQISIAHTATKGTVSIGSSPLDGYGFGMERRWVNASTMQECVARLNEICIAQVLFYGWGSGDIQDDGQVTGAPLSDMTPCAPDTVTVTSLLLGEQIQITSTGAIH